MAGGACGGRGLRGGGTEGGREGGEKGIIGWREERCEGKGGRERGREGESHKWRVREAEHASHSNHVMFLF